jgi:hypothetical protein
VRSFRKSEGAARLVERRRREDDAPRLKHEVPALEKLDLEINDSRGEVDPGSTYVRRVVVDQAPALFVLPCADPSCSDGGHDITSSVMYSLRSGAASFDGRDECHGSVGSAPCGRVLTFVAKAAYRSP